MKMPSLSFFVLSLMVPIMTLAQAPHAVDTTDPYLWLEDVTGDKQLAWVKEQDAKSKAELESRPGFKELHDRLLAIYNSKERIPGVTKHGKWLYNFWQDANNPRGVLRRTTLDEYRKADPKWETVLDIDKLDADENTNWVFKNMDLLYPNYERALVSLSHGGADAVEIREFDLVKKEFVKGGFVLPESKGEAEWIDRDTLYIARDFGPGTLTKSGYPRIVKTWKRGTPLADAKVVFEGQESDVGTGTTVVDEKGRRYETLRRAITFWEAEWFLRVGDKWQQIQVPKDARVSMFDGWLLVNLRSDWKPKDTNFKSGSLISARLDDFMKGGRSFEVVYEPTPRAALQTHGTTHGTILLNILDNVKSRVVQVRRVNGKWVSTNVPVPEAANVGVGAFDHDTSDDYWLTVTSFTEPTTLYLADAKKGTREKMKSLPAFFDAKGLVTTQGEATSQDGTKIPYFVVMREGTKMDGSNPTILYGYGGYEISMLPNYSGIIGSAWLERGGVWVLSNIRGGGEFGPEWHTQALRENRHRVHDDFIAVAEDIEKRGITSPKHLGIMGGSQGGLLVGTAFTQRPELYKAVVCQVPLLDMYRFNKLLAGNSWMGEYGNPDVPADWEFISQYSPYQNVFKDKKYPRIFFYTSTRDDRVHPGHARKMVAKMEAQGHDILYFEQTEGGHGAGTTPAQQAYMWALTYTFLQNELR